MAEGRTDGGKIYWGWYIVGAAFLTMGINYGSRYCFGIFVRPIALDLQWSRSVISVGASLMILSYAVGGIVSVGGCSRAGGGSKVHAPSGSP